MQEITKEALENLDLIKYLSREELVEQLAYSMQERVRMATMLKDFDSQINGYRKDITEYVKIIERDRESYGDMYELLKALQDRQSLNAWFNGKPITQAINDALRKAEGGTE